MGATDEWCRIAITKSVLVLIIELKRHHVVLRPGLAKEYLNLRGLTSLSGSG